jgi:hypothetical protein
MNRMFRVISHVVRPRVLVLAAAALVAGSGCGTDSVSPTALNDGAGGREGASPTGSGVLPAVTYTGLAYGPTSLWNGNRLNFGPAPFTASTNYINADTLILQINAARAKGQRLILALTGGHPSQFITNGQFDMAKWKARMNTYNKSTLKTAVAAAVSDGTVIGNQVIDEPETKQWGTVLNKTMVDQMVVYAKSIFPTLPMGVNHGPPAYKWHSEQKYTKVDYARYQYDWYITSGDVAKWRTAVLAQAKLDGVTPGFSINLINGGVKDKGDGSYDCAGPTQGDLGGYYPNCTMTPTQIVSYGKALIPYGCFFMLWQYDKTFFSKSANMTAFKTLATTAAATSKKSCKRPA